MEIFSFYLGLGTGLVVFLMGWAWTRWGNALSTEVKQLISGIKPDGK